MPRLTVAEKVLIHLSAFTAKRDSFVCPPDVSQRGIADAIGVSRAHAALELKALRESGDIEERVAHVTEARTRRKVYFTTPGGEARARDMREHARGRRVTVHTPRGSEELAGDEALQRLTRKDGWGHTEALIAVLTRDSIEAAPPEEVPAIEAPAEFFGREEELAALREWVARESPPMRAITGVTGVGKTALLLAFASGHDGPVHYHEVRSWDTAASLARSLGASLARSGKTRLREYVAGPVDVGETASMLIADAGDHLLIMDDCLDSPAGETLAKALLGQRGPKVLVAADRRPTFYGRRELVLDHLVEEVELDGLAADDAAAFAAHLGLTLPPEDVQRMTGGHPLSIRLMAAAGTEEGIREPARFVKEQLMAGLSPEERTALKRASVYRKPFPASALGPDSGPIDDLVDKGIVRWSSDGYALPATVASLIREHLSDQERREYHSAAADTSLDTGDELERLHHLAAAGRSMEVAMRVHRVGKGIVQAGGSSELCRILDDSTPPERYRAPWKLEEGRALDDLGRWDEAERALREASEAAEDAVRDESSLLLGRIFSKRGQLDEAREAFESLSGASDPLLRADALRGLGVVLRKLGEREAARSALEDAARMYGEASAPREAALTRMELGIVDLRGPDPGAAQAALRDALEVLEGDPLEEPRVRVNLAIACRMAEDLEGALENLELAAEMAGDVGQLRTAVYALANAVDVLLALGEVGRAGESCHQAEEWMSGLDEPLLLSLVRANQGEVAARRGNVEETRALFEESIALLEDGGGRDGLENRVEAYARALGTLGEDEAAGEVRERLGGR